MGSMTKAEVAKLLGIIAEMYPRFTVTEMKVMLWLDLIGDMPFKLAQMALKKVMLTSEFPPTVAEIRKAAADITTSEDGILDAGKAWGEVQRAIQKWGWPEPEKALAMMSPHTRRVVKQIGWGEICQAEELSVIRGQFMRMFDSMKVREEQDRLLPAGFLNQIKMIGQSMNSSLIESAATKEELR